MSRFCGKVGYIETVDHGDGVFVAESTERLYYGDVTRNASRWQKAEGLNDDLVINNTISIVADPYAYEHFPYIRYVEWHGTLWSVSSIEEQRPRLILILGGVYNGETD